MRSFPGCAEVTIDAIRAVADSGSPVESVSDARSIGSSFGRSDRPFREVVGYSARIESPRARLPWFAARRVNRNFALANAVWVCLGLSDPTSLLRFTRDGSGLVERTGGDLRCAFGRRLGAPDQPSTLLGNARRTLEADPSSRRVYLPLIWPEDLADPVPLDFSCAAGIQLFNRTGGLHMHTTMRSQSVVGVMPYDLMVFTLVHELFVASLGLEVGSHIYTAGSLHIYEDEMATAQAMARSPHGSIEMHPMGASDVVSLDAIRRLFRNDPPHPEDTVSEYWQAIFNALLDNVDSDSLTRSSMLPYTEWKRRANHD